jgi:hypothetical protein
MVRKFDLNKHESRLLVYAMGVCLRMVDDDDPEMHQLGFTRGDVLRIIEKLGVDPGLASSVFIQRAPDDTSYTETMR